MEPIWWFEGFKEILSMQKLWSETMPESESSYHGFRYAPLMTRCFRFSSRGSNFRLDSVLSWRLARHRDTLSPMLVCICLNRCFLIVSCMLCYLEPLPDRTLGSLPSHPVITRIRKKDENKWYIREKYCLREGPHFMKMYYLLFCITVIFSYICVVWYWYLSYPIFFLGIVFFFLWNRGGSNPAGSGHGGGEDSAVDALVGLCQPRLGGWAHGPPRRRLATYGHYGTIPFPPPANSVSSIAGAGAAPLMRIR